MSNFPWNGWIPGVLSRAQVVTLCKNGNILEVKPEDIAQAEKGENSAIDESSIDLHISNNGAYQLNEGTVKPFGRPYIHFLTKENLIQEMRPGPDGSYLLNPRSSYLFKLRERLSGLQGSPIYGQATAKSSIGRVDVLARLIVDTADCYEGFQPQCNPGDMFVEVTPMTFPVTVSPGDSLTQLRLFCGDPHFSEISGREVSKTVLHGQGESDGTLSVDLSDTAIAGHKGCAFCAVRTTDLPAIPLGKRGELPKPWKYWRLLRANSHQRFRIANSDFYILRSKELISVPKGIAVYCRAIDETIGEMRIHYAGFVHPFFGCDRNDSQPGTPLIFEVRGHDVDANLCDGERMARLTFYRMSEDAKEPKGTYKLSEYNQQTLQLSSRFASWPSKGELNEKGMITPALH